MLLRRHRADDSVAKAISKLIRADLIIVDDVGLLPVAPDAAEALFRVVDAAYERRSIALTSNIHPAGFDELMPKTLAAATVDRLLHHAHVLLTDGLESYRLTQATAGKGVTPLASWTRRVHRRSASPYGLGSATTDAHPRDGENQRPPAGRKDGRPRGEPMAALGEKPMTVGNRSHSGPTAEKPRETRPRIGLSVRRPAGPGSRCTLGRERFSWRDSGGKVYTTRLLGGSA